MNDYYRPSEDQITIHYQCQNCGAETEMPSCYGAGQCSCGGQFVQTGESYPADSSEWNEQRDPDGEWRERRY